MPTKNVNGTNIYFEIHGIAPEVMVFNHGLFFSGKAFRDQIDYFKARYKCLVIDSRGQGRSEQVEEGFDLDTVADDTVELIKYLNLGPCHVVGHSSGGAIALRIACRHRELLKSLILIDTTADSESAKMKFNFTKTTIQTVGLKSIASKVMKQLFGQQFLMDKSRAEDVVFWRNELTENKKSIAKSLSAYINRESIVSELGNIPVPTLIIVGEYDSVTPPEKSKNIKLKIPQARLATIKEAGHYTIIEQPWQVIEAIEVFLNGVH